MTETAKAAIATSSPETSTEELSKMVLPKTPLMKIGEYLASHFSDISSSGKSLPSPMESKLQNELLPHFRNAFPKLATGDLSLDLEKAVVIPGAEPLSGSIRMLSEGKAVAHVRFDASGQILYSGENR